MIDFYLRDVAGIYIGRVQADPMGPVPRRSSTIQPPALSGTEVARWNGSGWDLLAQAPAATPEEQTALNAQIAATRWELLKIERDDVRAKGGVQAGGHWFHTDIDSRIKWLGLKDSARDMLTAGGSPASVVLVNGTAVHWKTMTGTFVPVTAQLALDVVEAVKALDAALFVRAEQHYALMLASNAATYDYSTGWPPRFLDQP